MWQDAMFRLGVRLTLGLAVGAGAAGAAWAQAGGALPASPTAQALAAKVDLDFESTSLDNVLQYINRIRPGLNVVVSADVKAAGIDLSTRVVDIRVKQVPLEPILRFLLEPDLALKVERERIVVTTRKKLHAASTATYPVGDILRRLKSAARPNTPETVPPGAVPPLDNSSNELIEVVQRMINKNSDPDVLAWTEEKGTATIAGQGGNLVLSQSPRGHERMADLLARLRRAWAAQDAATAGAKPPQAEPEPEEMAAVRRTLAEKLDLDFENTSLDNVLKYIGEVQRGLNIVMDPAMSNAGIDLATRVVDLKVKRVSVEAVLGLILGDDLWYRVEPGYVLITTREKLQQDLPLEVYPVADLLKGAAQADAWLGDAASRGGFPYGSVGKQVDLICCLVNNGWDPQVAAWVDEGGPASLQCLPGVLIATQTPRGHERIADFLGRLRWGLVAQGIKGIAWVTPPRPPEPEPEEIAEVRRRLKAEIDLDFEKTSLDNVLKYIGAVQGNLNLAVDTNVSNAGIDLSTRVVDLKVKRAPVSTVLDVLLAGDLGYRVEPGYVLITTSEKLRQNLPLAIYPVADILKAYRQCEGDKNIDYPGCVKELIDIIQIIVRNQADRDVAAWSHEGGEASIQYVVGMLMVTQTPRGHARIGRLLGDIRRGMDVRDACLEAKTPVLVQPVIELTGPDDPALAATQRRLDEKISIRLREAGLDRALELLRAKCPGLNLVVDQNVPGEGIDISERKVTIEAEEEKIGSVLSRMLGEGLGLKVLPGCVLVTSRETAVCGPVVVYPVADLVRAIAKRMPPPETAAIDRIEPGKARVQENPMTGVSQCLMDELERTVNNESDKRVAVWRDKGGPASALYLAGLLIVCQTPEGHQKVLEYLNRLRRESLEGTK